MGIRFLTGGGRLQEVREQGRLTLNNRIYGNFNVRSTGLSAQNIVSYRARKRDAKVEFFGIVL